MTKIPPDIKLVSSSGKPVENKDRREEDEKREAFGERLKAELATKLNKLSNDKKENDKKKETQYFSLHIFTMVVFMAYWAIIVWAQVK